MSNFIQNLRESLRKENRIEQTTSLFDEDETKLENAARARGFSGTYWHGARSRIPKDFQSFKGASYFTKDRRYATHFGGSLTYPFFLHLGKTLDLKPLGSSPISFKRFARFMKQQGISVDETILPTTESASRENEPAWYYIRRMHDLVLLSQIEKAGYESCSLLENYHYRRRVIESMLIINPKAIKLALLYTYDDKGHEIPIADRFNINIPDVRY